MVKWKLWRCYTDIWRHTPWRRWHFLYRKLKKILLHKNGPKPIPARDKKNRTLMWLFRCSSKVLLMRLSVYCTFHALKTFLCQSLTIKRWVVHKRLSDQNSPFKDQKLQFFSFTHHFSYRLEVQIFSVLTNNVTIHWVQLETNSHKLKKGFAPAIRHNCCFWQQRSHSTGHCEKMNGYEVENF